jgi:hypothetical protein
MRANRWLRIIHLRVVAWKFKNEVQKQSVEPKCWSQVKKCVTEDQVRGPAQRFRLDRSAFARSSAEEL